MSDQVEMFTPIPPLQRKLRGVLAKMGEINNPFVGANNSTYSLSMMRSIIDAFELKEAQKPRTTVGRFWHKDDNEFDILDVSHIITSLELEGEEDDSEYRGTDLGADLGISAPRNLSLIVEFDLIDTPKGRMLQTMIENNALIGFSARFRATVDANNETTITELSAIDAITITK